MKSKHNPIKLSNSSNFYLIVGLVLTIAILIFVLQFNSWSFSESKPQDWETFVSYIGGILTPILTFINVIVFISLTKTVHRASENKAWVERTENLIFDLIDAISAEAAMMALFSSELGNQKTENQKEFAESYKINDLIIQHNKLVTEKEFKLRVYAKSNLFNNCDSREVFLKSLSQLIPKLNAFLNIYSKPEKDKSILLQTAFSEIENALQDTVEKGKIFCDEIYYLK